MIRSRCLGHRAPLLWLVLPFGAGITMGRLTDVLPTAWALGAAALLCATNLIPSLRREQSSSRSPVAWACLLAAGLSLAGYAAYHVHNPRVHSWDTLPPREATVSVRVQRIFPRSDGSAAGIGSITQGGGRIRELAGQRVYFSVWRAEFAVMRSAVVRCTGVLAPVPAQAPAGSFDRYLADGGVHFRLSRGRIEAIEQPPSPYYEYLEHAAQQMNRWLSVGIQAKRADLTAVYRAMMLGQKHELSREQDERFMHSGTMHLFAINGIHIGVVAVSIHALLALLRLPRSVAALITLAVLWFDVDTTGASPSAVRAFILVACYEAGFVFRRPANGIATLSGAAIVMLLVDPNTLFSASFQMSYGVVLAILCFGLPFTEWLEAKATPFRNIPKVDWRWWQRAWDALLRKVWPLVGIGLSALLVSTVTGPEFFNVFAPIGFVTNLVLVPLAMFVIIAGFISVLVGALGAAWLCGLFNHAALLILVVIDFFIRQSAGSRRPGGRRPGGWTGAQPWR